MQFRGKEWYDVFMENQCLNGVNALLCIFPVEFFLVPLIKVWLTTQLLGITARFVVARFNVREKSCI